MDHASATPIDNSVQKVLRKYESGFFSNPNGIHDQSLHVRKVTEKARASIARALGAHSDEIIFTSSGTESDALAILGLVYKYSESGFQNIPHIVTTNIEHSAVTENCKMLETKGLAEVTYVPVEVNGIVDPKKIEEALKENTVLVSVMYANNEIGTIQPIQEIAKFVRRERKKRGNTFSGHTDFSAEKSAQCSPQSVSQAPAKVLPLFFHTDACQAMNYLFTENIDKLGVDMMTFNGSKIYGPKGVGVLYKKRNVELSPIYGGGGQENGLRSGTEDVSRISGISKALEVTNKLKDGEVKRLINLRDYFFTQIPELEKSTGYEIHTNGDKENRLPNNINVSIRNISSELLVIELSAVGIAVSSKSACKSTEEESSHVIHALRIAGDEFSSEESLRITIGRDTKINNIKELLKALESILLKYRKWK
jgi:cysteine desulfurase